MEFFMQALLVGTIKGAVYVIIALSLVIIYKSSEVFNLAVGEFVVLGGISYLVAYSTGLPLYLVVPLFLIFCALGGAITEKIVIQPLMGRDPLSTTLATIGLSIFLIGFYQITLGTHPIGIEFNLTDMTFEAGELFFTSEQIWSAILAVGSIVILISFYQFSRWGIVMRATAEGQVKAMAFGVNTRFTLTLTWMLAAMIAGVGGLLVSWTGSLQYNMGYVGFVAIPVILIAGLDSIGGCIIGGILVGITEALTTFYLEGALGLPGFRSVTPYLLLLVVLMIRPTGLFGQERIERV